MTVIEMAASPSALRAAKRSDPHDAGVEMFWSFSSSRGSLKDSERLEQIKEGFSAGLVPALRMTFNLQERNVEILMNASISALERRRREQEARLCCLRAA